jgi:hypothetical protein
VGTDGIASRKSDRIQRNDTAKPKCTYSNEEIALYKGSLTDGINQKYNWPAE